MAGVREDWREVLDRRRVETVLWPRERSLAQALSERPGWRRVYRDDEAVVFAERIARRLVDAPLEEAGASRGSVPPLLPDEVLGALRARMQETCGVVRTGDGLSGLLDWIDATGRQHGPANALTAARLIAEPALARTHSCGAHYRADHPDPPDNPRRSLRSRTTQPDTEAPIAPD